MNFPTDLHRKYVAYITSFCRDNHISLLLKGSVAKGTAREFSDIDLLLCGDMNTDFLDRLIEGFGKTVMTNITENPKGILILDYADGISVDLDIRETVLESELAGAVLLCDNGFSISEKTTRKYIPGTYFPERPAWYKAIHLIHRCTVKHLCGREKTARSLIAEVIRATAECCGKSVRFDGNLKQTLTESFSIFCAEYPVEEDVIILLRKLFDKMDDA